MFVVFLMDEVILVMIGLAVDVEVVVKVVVDRSLSAGISEDVITFPSLSIILNLILNPFTPPAVEDVDVCRFMYTDGPEIVNSSCTH